MRKTKIMATIGPASQSIEILKDMMPYINIVRLNMTHSTHEFCDDIIEKVEKLNKKLNTNVSILLDLKGPDVTVGPIKNNRAYLKDNDLIRIYEHQILGDETKFSTNYINFVEEVYIGSIIKINDGLIELEVVKKEKDCLICQVKHGGNIEPNKTINVQGIRLDMPSLTKKDIDDIKYACQKKVDFLAISFVSCGEDVLTVNDILIKEDNEHTALIAKIEDELGVDNLDEIIEVSDGIMVARGDLGVNVLMEKIPGIQKNIIRKCHEIGKPSIVATELMASMEQNLRPTRAEVSDVANAILDGADCVMLSGETTIGNNPNLTVQTMDKIILSAESDIKRDELVNSIVNQERESITTNIAKSVVNMANNLKCQAIITPTITGYTAKKISRFRPSCPILAISPDKGVVKNLNLYFGVYAYYNNEITSFDKMSKVSKELALSKIEKGKIIMTGGYPFKEASNTNFIHIEEI